MEALQRIPRVLFFVAGFLILVIAVAAYFLILRANQTVKSNGNALNQTKNAPRQNFSANFDIKRITDLNDKPIEYGFSWQKGLGLMVSGVVVKDGIQDMKGTKYISIVVPTDKADVLVNAQFKNSNDKILFLKLTDSLKIPENYRLAAVNLSDISPFIMNQRQILLTIDMNEEQHNSFNSLLSSSQPISVGPVLQITAIGN